MSSPDVRQFLADASFLADMPAEYIDTIAECARLRDCSYGAYLAFEGDHANSFFVVVTGKVALQSSAGSLGFYTIETLADGDLIGWSWMFPPYRWTLTARVLAPTQVIEVDALCIRGKCEQDPRLRYLLMKHTAIVSSQRLLAARLALVENLA